MHFNAFSLVQALGRLGEPLTGVGSTFLIQPQDSYDFPSATRSRMTLTIIHLDKHFNKNQHKVEHATKGPNKQTTRASVQSLELQKAMNASLGRALLSEKECEEPEHTLSSDFPVAFALALYHDLS